MVCTRRGRRRRIVDRRRPAWPTSVPEKRTGLPSGVAGGEVDAVRQVRHQRAALGIEGDLDFPQIDRDRLGERLPHAAVDDGHPQLAVARIDLVGKAELDGKRAGLAGAGIVLETPIGRREWR